MKPLDIFKAPFTLGWLSLVMAAMAALLLGASNLVWETPAFDASNDRMELLDSLQGDVANLLAKMQLSETDALFYASYGLAADEDYAQNAQDNNQAIDELMAELDDTGYFDEVMDEVFDSDLLGTRAAFDQLRAQHRQTFDETMASLEDGDEAQIEALLSNLEAENQALRDSLSEMQKQVEIQRRFLQLEFPTESNRIIQLIAIGLTAILLLALLGYLRLAAAAAPVSALTNAIMAIGGGTYRSELIAGLLKKTGPAGESARSLDRLAAGLVEGNAGLTAQIDQLRQALYESRRRRLKISRPGKNAGDAQ